MIRGTIRAGDLLYMPPFWWHFVTLEEPSISVNFWWRSDVSQCLCPAALKRLPGAFERGFLPQTFQQLDITGFDSIHAIGKDFAARGARAAAVLITAAALEAGAAAHGITWGPDGGNGWKDRWSKIENHDLSQGRALNWSRAREVIEAALVEGDPGVTEAVLAGFIRAAAEFKWS